MFDGVWEKIHSERVWGRYPKEELVRWCLRIYGDAPRRSQVRFLDLGCGAGASSGFLAGEGFAVTALDGSASAVKRAVPGGRWVSPKEYWEAPPNLVGVVADAMNLPFKNETYDAVIDLVCVAHNRLSDARQIVREINRVLKPGGKVFSALPAKGSTPDPYMNKGAITFFDLYEATDLYSKIFKEVQVDYTLTEEGGRHTKLWFVKSTKETA